jgi:hypothetical protein
MENKKRGSKMNIKEARELKVGDRVSFPVDRGEPAGTGIISHIGESTCVNINRTKYAWTKYAWITLKAGGVWPSNRITKINK